MHSRGDGGRDIEYRTSRDDIVRVDCKLAASCVGVGRVSAFSGRLESTPGYVTGILVAYPASFSKDAISWLQDKRARNFLGSQDEFHDVVLISGDSLAEQMDAMQRINSDFRDQLCKLEGRWVKVDRVPTILSPTKASSAAKRPRGYSSDISTQNTDTSVHTSLSDSSDDNAEMVIARKRKAVAPQVGMAVKNTPSTQV